MNAFIIKPNRLIFALLIAVLMIVSLPLSALQVFAAPEDNMTVEYRYVEGEDLAVPATMVAYNRTYRLVGQDAPVLESTLPKTRTYNYNVSGYISPEDLASIPNIGDMVFTPHEVVQEEEVDMPVVMHNLPSNDAEQIPMSETFTIDTVNSPTGKADVTLTRAGLKFEVETWEIDNELPDTYKATVIYRGVESWKEVAYTTVESSFTSTEPDGDANVYVIVARYEPTDLIAGPGTTTPTTPGVTTPTAPGAIAPGVTTPDAAAPVGATPPAAPADFTTPDGAGTDIGDGNIPLDGGDNTTIGDGQTPLASGANTGWSLISMILSVFAVAIGAVLLVKILSDRNKSQIDNMNIDSNDRNRRNLLRALIFIFSVATPVMWLIVDDLTKPLVLVNTWTPIIAIALAVNIACMIVYITVQRKGNSGNAVA